MVFIVTIYIARDIFMVTHSCKYSFVYWYHCHGNIMYWISCEDSCYGYPTVAMVTVNWTWSSNKVSCLVVDTTYFFHTMLLWILLPVSYHGNPSCHGYLWRNMRDTRTTWWIFTWMLDLLIGWGCGRRFGGGTDTNDCWKDAYSCCTYKINCMLIPITDFV